MSTMEKIKKLCKDVNDKRDRYVIPSLFYKEISVPRAVNENLLKAFILFIYRTP